jgi:ubiquitin-large subunit ribosomal protein L40e
MTDSDDGSGRCTNNDLGQIPQPLLFEVMVRTLTGRVIAGLYGTADDAIDHLKQQIYERENVEPDRQCLIYGGRILEDHRTLAECQITNENCVVYFVPRMNSSGAPGYGTEKTINENQEDHEEKGVPRHG